MFKPATNRVNFPTIDTDVLEFWEQNKIFERSFEDKEGQPKFMLYEGPPTANGNPGIHHVLARVFKDVICRYKTMKGFQCIRKGGWDTHGLPVELEIEKELGLKSKKEIEEYGIKEFNEQCKNSVFTYVKEWEQLTARIGYWVDLDDPYVTLHNSYIESGWWILKTLWDQGLLYEGRRATPHCPRCVTSLSSHEVALGYKDNVRDPSVFVKFLVDFDRTDNSGISNEFYSTIKEINSNGNLVHFVAWTTTPWTLPSNAALAINKDESYVAIKFTTTSEEDITETQYLVMAQALIGAVLDGSEDYEVLASTTGSLLESICYIPLFDPTNAELPQGALGVFQDGSINLDNDLNEKDMFNNSFKVHTANWVSMSDGSGIVHIAPAFGEDDLALGREKGIGFIQTVDLQGIITGNYSFAGKFVKNADKEILSELNSRGLLLRNGTYRHTYPFCWRCDSPLLYYAKSSWYIRTTEKKDELVKGNQKINWYPDHVKNGRFGEWLQNNVDWAVSRERYWGTPMPIWECPDCLTQICVGSVEELNNLSKDFPVGEDLDLHRPFIDEIKLNCSTENCNGTMTRIPEVMDAWFDSGAMPFAQFHYPFSGENNFADQFPADYICEAVDQTRGWFYSLHALGTLLKNQPAYNNVICLGLILDEKGQKMSKRIGNIVEPMSVLEIHGADALRWYLFTASHPGESRRFSERLVGEVFRKMMLTLWNVYSFFTNYASLDEYDPTQTPADWRPHTELDRWILSELNSLINEVDELLDKYNPTDAGRVIQEFVDNLSNWYVRRSRRRFWKSENDTDKTDAYNTLYRCLVTVSELMAPLAPFVSEELYQKLVKQVDPSASDSVHLSDFPMADESLIDEELMKAIRLAMKVSSLGRSVRSRAGLKVRQPLSDVLVSPKNEDEARFLFMVSDQILEELNIKTLNSFENATMLADIKSQLSQEKSASYHSYVAIEDNAYIVAVNTHVTEDLKNEGLIREISHRIQGFRKDAGLDLNDRITTYMKLPATLVPVVERFSDFLKQETLTSEIVFDGDIEYDQEFDIEGENLQFRVMKV
ncbi:MAG: isoleucine--tRNA ligase [Dehalococcoidia bacterium]